MSVDRKTWEELVETDIFALNDDELKKYLRAWQGERKVQAQNVVKSVSQCDNFISTCQAELSARASDRLTKMAIWIAVASIFFSAIFTGVQVLVPTLIH